MERRRVGKRDRPKKDSGFLGTGHYPIPVLEESLGLASPDTMLFKHDADYIYGVLNLSFDSILTASSDRTAAAVAGLKTEHYETVREKTFSLAVMDVLRHLRPDVQVLPDQRVGEIVDFGIAYQGGEVFVETRWRPGPTDQATRAALSRLIDNLPMDVGLLVVVNSDEPPNKAAYEVIDSRLPDRGRILAWQERTGGDELELALHALIAAKDN